MKLRCATEGDSKAFVVSLVVLLVVAASTGQAVAQQDPTPGVVKILAHGDADGPQREGSGFVVGFDGRLTFIATAAHVVEGDSRPKVVFAVAPHVTYEAMPIQIETASDIAVLKVIGYVPGMIVLPLDERPVAPADPLQAIGFPRRALQPRWSTAAASSREGARIVLDEQLAEGHSGGPLLREGWVVGLVNATEADFSYATSALSLSQILESWRVPFQMQSTRKAAPVQEPKPEETRSTSMLQPSMSPQTAPGNSGCFGVVTSLTGSGQPVRASAFSSSPAKLSLPRGTRVAIVSSQPGDALKWYQVAYEKGGGGPLGWMQSNHLELSAGCRK